MQSDRVAPATGPCLLVEVDDALHGAVPLHHADGLQRRHVPAAAGELRTTQTSATTARGLRARPSRGPYIGRSTSATANRCALSGLLAQFLGGGSANRGGRVAAARGCAPISGSRLLSQWAGEPPPGGGECCVTAAAAVTGGGVAAAGEPVGAGPGAVRAGGGEAGPSRSAAKCLGTPGRGGERVRPRASACSTFYSREPEGICSCVVFFVPRCGGTGALRRPCALSSLSLKLSVSNHRAAVSRSSNVTI